jgi:hypothetical protein
VELAELAQNQSAKSLLQQELQTQVAAAAAAATSAARHQQVLLVVRALSY